MADGVAPRRRRRWVVPLVVAGVGVWIMRSRRNAEPAAWLPPLPAPAADSTPRHAAATPAAATLDPTPTGEPPKHAAPATTTNGSGPATPEPAVVTVPETVPEPAPEPAPETNPLFTESADGGSAPLPDGSAPGPEFVIKGNADSMLFHTQSSPYYGRTKAEVWFRTEEEATAAGFTKWTRRRPNS